MGPVTAVALIAHHTPTLTSFNNTSWIGNGNLLFWQFTYISNWNLIKHNECEVYFSIIPIKIPVQIFSLPPWSASEDPHHSSLTRIQLPPVLCKISVYNGTWYSKNFKIFVKCCLDLYDTSCNILANEFDGWIIRNMRSG